MDLGVAHNQTNLDRHVLLKDAAANWYDAKTYYSRSHFSEEDAHAKRLGSTV